MKSSSVLAGAVATVLVLSATAGICAEDQRVRMAFSVDMLGVSVSRFEQVAGHAARHVVGARYYVLDGCRLTMYVEGSTVRGLAIEPGKRCSVDLNRVLPGQGPRFPASDALTFGAFERIAGFGSYRASCLEMCGNAVDPMAFLVWDGTGARQGQHVALGSVIAGDVVVDAANKWADAMRHASGDEFVLEARFNCGPTSQESVARKSFALAHVDRISMGLDGDLPKCDAR